MLASVPPPPPNVLLWALPLLEHNVQGDLGDQNEKTPASFMTIMCGPLEPSGLLGEALLLDLGC